MAGHCQIWTWFFFGFFGAFFWWLMKTSLESSPTSEVQCTLYSKNICSPELQKFKPSFSIFIWKVICQQRWNVPFIGKPRILLKFKPKQKSNNANISNETWNLYWTHAKVKVQFESYFIKSQVIIRYRVYSRAVCNACTQYLNKSFDLGLCIIYYHII